MINEFIDTFMSLASVIADIHVQRKHSEASIENHQTESRRSRTRENTFLSFAKGAWWCIRWFGIIDRPMNFHWLCVHAKLMCDVYSRHPAESEAPQNADSYRHLNDTATQKGNQCHPNQFVCKQTHTTCTLCPIWRTCETIAEGEKETHLWKGGKLAKLMKWVTDIQHQSFVNCSERSQSADNQCRTEVQLFKTRMHAEIGRKVFCCIADVYKNK